MMPFAEKLSFLMYITQTSNKELAAELSVDPSMISLLRTGKRKLSKNSDQAKKMAAYFAKRSSAVFQRQALSEMLGQVSISPSMPTEVLASSLETWLQGESDNIAHTILSGIQSLPANVESVQAPFPGPAPASKSQTLFFYGEEGRREVMARMMQEMQQMEVPGSVLTVVDDNLEWLLSDYLFTKKIQAGFMELSERGFSFHQIMPPLNYINRYAESLQFWMPIYATGKTKVYYYPRLRGNLYRHSIIVVPGRCVQYAASVGLGSTSDITMFSTDPKLVSAFEKQFQEHVALCKPSLDVYQSPGDFIPRFLELFSRGGDTIQQINALSVNSMPRELLEWCVREAGESEWEEGFRMHLEELSHFEERLGQDKYIDMCRLASAEDVRAGKVPVVALSKAFPGYLSYTPETYCLHLKNILRLMDKYENYSFLPLHEKECPDYNLFVSEGGMALLVRAVEPFVMMEIRRPPMITAFREHLLRRADAVGYEGISREKVRMELRALIQELGG
ncbi:MAG: hypothetical protein PUB32_04535 [Clostridiales bacterium]|nr:hypothetical protein [Clostridiales bacterium]